MAEAVARLSLLILFFASGTAALIYELVWFHLVSLVVGASSLSIAALLASFMGGMAIGPLVGGLLLQHFWWGSAFLLGVPFMVLLVIVVVLWSGRARSAAASEEALRGRLHDDLTVWVLEGRRLFTTWQERIKALNELKSRLGGMAEEAQRAEIEVRASWTPVLEEGVGLPPHLAAWAELLCTTAGLPPLPAGVVLIPSRRNPPSRTRRR